MDTLLEKQTYTTMEQLLQSHIELQKENERLKAEIASLRFQLNEKDARLLEAKCSSQQQK